MPTQDANRAERIVLAQHIADSDSSRHIEVKKSPSDGWDVLERRDGEVVREASYGDWHRVELEMRRFTAEAAESNRLRVREP